VPSPPAVPGKPAGRSLRRRIGRFLVRLFALAALVAAAGATGYVAHDSLPSGTANQAAVSPSTEVIAEPLPPPPPTSAATSVPPPQIGGDAGILPPLDGSGAASVKVRGTAARALVLLDAADGRVLLARHEHRPLPIASLTKVMTAVLAVRGGHLSQELRIRRQWLGIGGSSIYLVPRQRITVRMLLYGLLMVSGNDAANVLATYRAGSVPSFVEAMNAEARRLGLDDTRFSSPSGLLDRGNRSTAWDVADLARYLLEQPLLAEITRTKTLPAPHHVTWVNHNRLLFRYAGANGMKTGYTDVSGPCLVASATRRGRTLIAVVLHAKRDEFTVAERMLDWGFAHPG
jgi:serine-type D-Ala-D-Ala carboxypeptidase (penicillin-binding protein 5/6)